MVITYYGKGFVRLSFGDMVVAINPISKSADAKSSRFGADIVLSSLCTPVFTGFENMTGGSKEPFIIAGAGEYELSDVFIKGYEAVGPAGKINTVYTIVLEGMKIVHLGALAEANLTDEVVEEVTGADILFVPAGDEGSLEAKEAGKLASSLIPKIVIPVLYGEEKKSSNLNIFAKEVGGSDVKSIDKLSLKKKDLELKEGELVILEVI